MKFLHGTKTKYDTDKISFKNDTNAITAHCRRSDRPIRSMKIIHTDSLGNTRLSQAYVNYVMGPPWVSFSFRTQPSTHSLFHMLVSFMMFAFCFHGPMWLPCSLMVAQHLRFATLQLFVEYTFGKHICLLVVVCVTQ